MKTKHLQILMLSTHFVSNNHDLPCWATVTLGRRMTRCCGLSKIAEIDNPCQTSPTACFNPRGVPAHPDRRKMAFAYRTNRLWASESCMSVDECTRTVSGVRIPHAVCVRNLRYVYTHARFLRCLYTYGRSLTGTDEWRRSDAIATLGDDVCSLTARPDGMPTWRDGLPTQKCDNPRMYMCLYDILEAARTWFLPLGSYMQVRALVRMFHSGLPNIIYLNSNLYVYYTVEIVHTVNLNTR